MKKLITMILAALALTVGSLAEGADTTMKSPQTGMTKPVPAGYTAPSEHPGTVVQVEYDSQDYLRGDAPVTKTAWVYLPWLTTPDGRDGWAQMFLRNGHAAYLVDQPGRGEAGAATSMTMDGFLDAWAEDSKDFKPGDQAWYTHFRIGRVAPERYEGSQFPEGEEAQNQFFRQMTPNTTTFDMAKSAAAVSAVLAEVKERTGNKSVFITHSQGGAVGWDVDVENISAIIAIEPGGAPQVDSEQYNKLLEAKIPIIFYYGDYMENGPEDIMSSGFWSGIKAGSFAFAEAYNAAGGDATVIDLPAIGITGNSHFMFQELNNQEIADHIENWLGEHGLN